MHLTSNQHECDVSLSMCMAKCDCMHKEQAEAGAAPWLSRWSTRQSHESLDWRRSTGRLW